MMICLEGIFSQI